MKFLKSLLAATLFAALCGGAAAQQVVITQPAPRVTTNASSTITVTDTFQSVWASQSARVNCAIQNNGASTMWVFSGVLADATKGKSVVLAPGQMYNCATSGVVATSQISITGTSGEAFFAGLDGGPIISGSSTSGSISGSVAVTSVVSGVGATNLGKAEDAAHASGDTGVASWGVVTNGSTALAATGDYSVMGTDTAGNLRVVGSTATGTAPGGNPVYIAGQWPAGLGGTGFAYPIAVDSGGVVYVQGGAFGTGGFGPANTFFASGGTDGTTGRIILQNTLGAQYAEAGPYSYSRKTADGQVKGSAGFLHTISVAGLTATPTAGLMTVYDSLTETGTVIYSEWIFATVAGHTITLDVPTTTGIFIGFDATLANAQVTASYR